jgi:hypothetical protein
MTACRRVRLLGVSHGFASVKVFSEKAAPAASSRVKAGFQARIPATLQACAFLRVDQRAAASISSEAVSEATASSQQLSCPPESCDTLKVAAGARVNLGTSTGGVENLYRLVAADKSVIGCLPLIYFRRPATEPVINASQTSQCLLVRNDTSRPVLVQIRCPAGCDWNSLSNGWTRTIGVSRRNAG